MQASKEDLLLPSDASCCFFHFTPCTTSENSKRSKSVAPKVPIHGTVQGKRMDAMVARFLVRKFILSFGYIIFITSISDCPVTLERLEGHRASHPRCELGRDTGVAPGGSAMSSPVNT